MNQGVIEQVGTPLEIYREPATAFVADFIGTMNFLPAESAGSGRVRVGMAELLCDAEDLAEIDTAGNRITLAIRPEDIGMQGVQAEDENAVRVKIEEAEFLGSFVRVDLAGGDLGGERLRADFSINLMRRFDINVGDEIVVALPREQLRFYAGAPSDG
jgi:iron(III) transport system ATP-binding protein